MSDGPFLSRWSRRKLASKATSTAGPDRSTADVVPAAAGTQLIPDPPVASQAQPPAPLPPVDSLTPDSDFTPFMKSEVDPQLKRQALKALFQDPRFNVMDGLDVYIDDYSKSEPIPAAMLASLRQAQNILGWAKEDEEQRAQDELKQKASAQAIEQPASQSAPESAVQADAPDAAPALPDGSGGPVQS